MLAAEYGLDKNKVYTAFDAFLADGKMNTVYIATPNLLHYEQVKKGAAGGKAPLIVRSPSVRRAEAGQRELTAWQKENHLPSGRRHAHVFLPNFEVIKNALLQIGRVKLVLGNNTVSILAVTDRLKEGRYLTFSTHSMAAGL